jgi:hypothetical protein
MNNTGQIREHMKVTGSDGQHVGTVDKVEGNQIKLAKNDPAAQGQHHYIPVDWVSSVDQDAVKLNKSAREAQQSWQGEQGAKGTASGATGGSMSGGSKGGNSPSGSSMTGI